MYIFKSCPKCGGDLALEREGVRGRLLDRDTDFTCLQCGYELQPSERRAMLVRITAALRARRHTELAPPTAA